MSSFVRHCLMMSVGGLVLAGVLLVAGVPAPVILGLAPVLVCVGLHLVMGHGDATGEHLLHTARTAVAQGADRTREDRNEGG